MEERTEGEAALLNGMVHGWARQLTDIMRYYREHRNEPTELQPLARAAFAPVAILTAAFTRIEPRPEWQANLERVAKELVPFALRASAREIGWNVYANGGLDLMHRVSDVMEDLSPDTFAGSILDKWWDGIGSHVNGVWVS
jgi:hypothetical protein